MKFSRTILVALLLAGLSIHLGCLSSSDPASGGLSGIVTDSAGNVLSGVRVSTTEMFAYTNSSGEWFLDGLKPQTQSVTATRENYESQSRTIEVLSGQVTTAVNFSLLEKGSLFSITIGDITSSEATISFSTRKLSTSHVNYGTNTLYEQSTSQTIDASTFHQVRLSGLTPATTYHFTCVATDELGRIIYSADTTFTTLYTLRGDPPTGLTLQKNPGNESIIVSWNEDTGGDLAGYKLYRASAVNGPFNAVDSSPIRTTSYIDSEVTPGEKAYYRVTKVSGTGEETPPSAIESFVLPGVTRQNLVWTPDQSPYYLSGDLTINFNTSLTIMNGVSVVIMTTDSGDLGGDGKVEIKVEGSLNIQGTQDAPVSFTSFAGSPQAGDWMGIRFTSNAGISNACLNNF